MRLVKFGQGGLSSAEMNDPRWGGEWGGSTSKPLRTLFPALDWTPESLRQAHLQFLALTVTYPLECLRLSLKLKLHQTVCKYVSGEMLKATFFLMTLGMPRAQPLFPPPMPLSAPPPSLNT